MEGAVTKVESRETDPVFLIEGAGNEMWVPLKDIRRLERSTGKGEWIKVLLLNENESTCLISPVLKQPENLWLSRYDT
jgi:hypothetical protein